MSVRQRRRCYRRSPASTTLLYLDQNYLSGIAKRKPSFRELEPVLRSAVARGAVAVPEAPAHSIESAPRPELGLLELLRGLSGGLRLPEPGTPERRLERRLASVLARELPERRARASDATDLETLALALPRCRLVTCDATMADVVRRSGLDVRFRCELFTGRRADVERLRERLASLMGEPFRAVPPGYGPGEEGGRDRMATNVDRETELPEDAAGARTDDDEAEEDGGVARLSLPGTWEEE